MTSRRDLNAEQRGMILRLGLAGVSPRQIAERMGIPESAVRLYYPAPKQGFQKGNKHGQKGWKKNAPKRSETA